MTVLAADAPPTPWDDVRDVRDVTPPYIVYTRLLRVVGVRGASPLGSAPVKRRSIRASNPVPLYPCTPVYLPPGWDVPHESPRSYVSSSRRGDET